MKQVTDHYYVSPQIAAEDVAAAKAAGIVAIICNRPDAEVPSSHQAAAIEAAAKAAGLPFHALPLTHQTMTPDNIAHQRSLIEEAGGPVLAYCASGTRSTVAWALGQAGSLPTDRILDAAAGAGYDLAGLRGTLDAVAAR